MNLIGTEYDDQFLLNNQKMYCSELIYTIFMLANNNDDFFQLHPMTFKVNGRTLDIWIDYFEKLNMKIPERELGINPGSISLSKKINIIHDYTK